MKKKNSKIGMLMAILFFAVSFAVNAQNSTTYLDLSKNQVKVGGLTENDIKTYVTKGFKEMSFDKDVNAKVEFLSAKGKKYFKTGIIKAGTKYLTIPTKPKKFILLGCGNWGGYSKV